VQPPQTSVSVYNGIQWIYLDKNCEIRIFRDENGNNGIFNRIIALDNNQVDIKVDKGE
jgi:hypothetical protein